jgi:microcystin-dependent protein
LFAAISTVYGAGDGSTTFNLPDCRGRVAAGKDDMGGTSANRLTNQSGGLNGDTLGAAGGAETHTLTEPQLPVVTPTGTSTTAAHTHFMFAAAGGSTQATSLPNVTSTETVAYSNSDVNAPYRAAKPTSTTSATLGLTSSGSGGSSAVTMNAFGSGNAHNNVQPTIIFNKIIKE